MQGAPRPFGYAGAEMEGWGKPEAVWPARWKAPTKKQTETRKPSQTQGWKQSLSSPDSPAGQNLAKPDFGLTYSRIPGFWADFLDSYPGFHLDSYLDAAIPGL